MKVYRHIVSSVFFTAISFVMASQEINRIEHVEMGGFIEKESISLLRTYSNISPILFEIGIKDSNGANGGSQVFIQQIGAYNIVTAEVSSQDSFLNLRQEGLDNDIDIKLVANEVNYNFSQKGANNFFHHSIFPSSGRVNVNMSQNGYGNHVENYGANSISNKMELNLKGDFKTLIIRNFP